jgi:hypothetical protein
MTCAKAANNSTLSDRVCAALCGGIYGLGLMRDNLADDGID